MLIGRAAKHLARNVARSKRSKQQQEQQRLQSGNGNSYFRPSLFERFHHSAGAFHAFLNIIEREGLCSSERPPPPPPVGASVHIKCK